MIQTQDILNVGGLLESSLIKQYGVLILQQKILLNGILYLLQVVVIHMVKVMQ